MSEYGRNANGAHRSCMDAVNDTCGLNVSVHIIIMITKSIGSMTHYIIYIRYYESIRIIGYSHSIFIIITIIIICDTRFHSDCILQWTHLRMLIAYD